MKITPEMLLRFQEAQVYFERLGFQNIEVPWIVSPDSTALTLPKERRDLSTHLGSLIGSGEQSFIELMFQGRLKPGRYQAITPCFREEPKLSQLHRWCFLKLELIHVETVCNPMDPRELAELVSDFYQQWMDVSVVQSGKANEFDIWGPEDIELGSYGYRRLKEPDATYIWTYGTGLAEPRFSIALEKVTH